MNPSASFVIQLFILMEMSGGVEKGRECKATCRVGAGLARKAFRGFPKLSEMFHFNYRRPI